MKKKVLIIAALTLVAAAIYFVVDYINLKKESAIQMEVFVPKAGFRSKCDRILPIDLTRIGDAEAIAAWIDKNGNYLTSRTPESSDCSASTVYFNADLYFDTNPSDLEKTNLAKWLRDNDDYICYREAYENIECAHLVTEERLNEIIDKAPAKAELTFGQLVGFIQNEGGTYVIGNYAQSDYDYFLRFYTDLLGGFEKRLTTTYSADGGYYSTSLIKSIEYRRNSNSDPGDDISTNTVFTFKKVRLIGKNPRIVFSIDKGNNEHDNYDFSQIPQTGTRNDSGFSPF
jgi:hypothetical protein